MVYDNVLKFIGHTPMVRLNRMVDEDSAEIFVKFEGLNVGGSIKTRTAYNMIKDAERKGLINENTVIVEPTSGNQGIGLALIGAVRGYKTVIIMPDSVSEERRKLVRHYGATVELVHDDGNIGKCIDECVKLAEKMAAEDPNVFVPQQFSNPANPLAHKYHTGVEILEQTECPIDGFCSGIGTGGTFSGTGRYLKEKNPDVKLVAVEPAGSPLLSGGKAGPHGLMGIGANFIPKNMDLSLIDEIICVREEDAYAAGRDMVACEGVLVGITAGAALWAATQLALRPENAGKTIVALLPDGGERYLSTPMYQGE